MPVIFAEDTDGDGLDDGWEARNFKTLTYSGNADPDGDGISNFNEYIQDSDPMAEEKEINWIGIMVVVSVAVVLILSGLIILSRLQPQKKKDSLKDMVSSMRSRGMKQDQIRQELVKSGYNLQEINKYL
jgi:hypothetical protein